MTPLFDPLNFFIVCLNTKCPYWPDLLHWGIFVIAQSLKTVPSLFIKELWTTYKGDAHGRDAYI